MNIFNGWGTAAQSGCKRRGARGCVRRRRHRWVALSSAALLFAMMTLPAHAQDFDVLADGLNGPQGVLVDDAGIVYVIETGLGGDQNIEIFETETAETVEASFGMSGRVMRIDPSTRDASQIATLPSVITPSGGFGGGRLLEHGGALYASVGEWATPGADRPEGLSTIMRIGADGASEVIADTWMHELETNPYDHGGPHSHPYGMAVAPDGRLLYADAGGNAVMAVDPSNGGIETIAVFEPLPGVFPRPDYDGEMLTEPVPTAVVVRDGRIVVSLLSGAPFVPGSAKVVEVGSDGSVSDVATGLTMLTDLREGPDGYLYATTFAVFGEEGPAPASGSVTRIHADGTHESVAEGLSFVTSIDFDGDGNAYVATNGVGPPGSGAIVVLAGLAGSAQLPTTGSGDLTVLLGIVAVAVTAAGVMLVRFRIN